jgi:hypothetical protein
MQLTPEEAKPKGPSILDKPKDITDPAIIGANLSKDSLSLAHNKAVDGAQQFGDVLNEFRIVAQAIDFLSLPFTYLMYRLRKKEGPSPLHEKNGWLNFGLSSVALGLGIAFIAASGAAPAIGIAMASVTLARGLWGLGTTIYELSKQRKKLAEIKTQKSKYENSTLLLAPDDPEKINCLKQFDADIAATENKITNLNSKKHYLDIAEKAIGAGIAVISVIGAVLAVSNPVIGAVALGLGIGFGVYNLAKFAREKYLNYKKGKSQAASLPAAAGAEVPCIEERTDKHEEAVETASSTDSSTAKVQKERDFFNTLDQNLLSFKDSVNPNTLKIMHPHDPHREETCMNLKTDLKEIINTAPPAPNSKDQDKTEGEGEGEPESLTPP